MPSVSELEYELEKLRQSTKRALEASWEDIERMQKELTSKDDQIHCLLKENHTQDNRIAKLEQELSKLRRPINGEDCNDLADPSNDLSAAENSLIMAASLRFSKRSKSAASTASSSCANNVGSFIKKCSSMLVDQSDQRTEVENDFMNQLGVMEQDKKIAVNELKLKLQQREAAIDTLEKVVTLRDETVFSLREENERLKGEIEKAACPPKCVKRRRPEIDRIQRNLSNVIIPCTNTAPRTQNRYNEFRVELSTDPLFFSKKSDSMFHSTNTVKRHSEPKSPYFASDKQKRVENAYPMKIVHVF
uniref:Uncharacterized protein n=1 Tax=Helicotheca tamesis TaxID=374047 RepID=A0A7S2I0P3_9STRA|mmetsp:Transcript_4604/g.6300  ORF Transcript_4604/g.6300 Transcript_4604/m.6300 type:complete len:304 (+) Transcript_4604:86-997(+)